MDKFTAGAKLEAKVFGVGGRCRLSRGSMLHAAALWRER